MQNGSNPEPERSLGMYLVKLSETLGVNLDHLIAWRDQPEYDSLHRTLLGGASDVVGAPMPNSLTLRGEERLKMLHWLAGALVDTDWQAAYEATRDENRMLSRWLAVVRENLTEEQQ